MSRKIHDARSLLLKEGFGVLSTISVDVPGYPFGSIVPYCVDGLCRPIIYISNIAQHTKNILADSRVSLTVMERNSNSDDVQAQGRLTCLAGAQAVGEGESELRSRYFRYFPSARQYEQTHDFALFRLEVVRLRFIGGFGQIFWVERDEFMKPNPFSFDQETRIIEHMNEDHADALRHYTRGESSIMTGIDADGFDLLASGRKVRIEFDTPVKNMDDARQALIALAKRDME